MNSHKLHVYSENLRVANFPGKGDLHYVKTNISLGNYYFPFCEVDLIARTLI